MVRLFISGLKEDIKHSVIAHEPKSYEEVLKQAHIQERRIQAEKGPIRPALANRGPPILPNPISAPPRNFTTTAHVPSTSPTQSQNRQPLKRLSHAEIQSRRERGLCYYCEEKYTAGHKCKVPPQLLLLTDGSDIEPTLPEQFASDDFLARDLQCLEIQEHSALSFNALAGGNSASTLRFTGHINGHEVQVLLDGGSTHNFIQTRVAKFLQLPINTTSSFPVVVGSGQRLLCDGVAPTTLLSV